jgi:hypothetical protein
LAQVSPAFDRSSARISHASQCGFLIVCHLTNSTAKGHHTAKHAKNAGVLEVILPQGRFAHAVKTDHADLGAVVEAERDVAQDHFVADGDETPHFVHGIDYKGFVGHSGVILSESGEGRMQNSE